MADRMREEQRGSERGEHGERIAPTRPEPPQEREEGQKTVKHLTLTRCTAARAAAKVREGRKSMRDVTPNRRRYSTPQGVRGAKLYHPHAARAV